MRVFQPTYSVPIPEGAKKLKRKDGTYVRFTTKRGQEVTGRLSRSGKRVVLPTSCYHVEFRDHQDVERRLKAFTDQASSNRVAATVQDLLNSTGSGQGVSADLRKRIESLPARMQRDLAEWGLLDTKASEAAKPLLELVEAYIQSLANQEHSEQYVYRTRLEIKSIFKACGFNHLSDIDADKVNAFLKRRRDKGISYRRSNALLMAVKCFCNWAVDREFLIRSPLRGKKAQLLDVQKDRRRVRRALEVAELQRLFKAAEASDKAIMYLSGPERALLYRVAAETGIRRGELRQLTVGDFDLAALTVTVQGRVSKNGKQRVVPLSPVLAGRLRQFFTSKLPTATWLRVPLRTAEMLRSDLEAAGISYRDDRGHYFDFHSLRGECATLLVESGVDPKVAQEILGHSDIRLTLSVYAKTLDEKAKRQAAAVSVSSMIEKAG